MTEQSPLPRILVVDESRMIRAMLVRQIREFYDFREEADGESAWQVLVLDHSVTLVICSLSLPVLDGDGLLARVRASRLERLAQMPMLMISGDDEQVIERARSHGASDFIRRGTNSRKVSHIRYKTRRRAYLRASTSNCRRCRRCPKRCATTAKSACW